MGKLILVGDLDDAEVDDDVVRDDDAA